MGNAVDDAAQREFEERVRAACDRTDYRAAATMLLETLGPKVIAFLLQRLRSPSDACEVFSMFNEDLWRGLPAFEWRCTVRGWCFAIARHAADRFAKNACRERRRLVPLSQAPLSDVVAEVRERTLMHLRTETRTQMHALFERLPADDRALVELRLDQNLSFRDLAVALGEEGPVPSDAALEREAARLRKRFQLVKGRLRELAQESGLLNAES